ncbi:17744_t:CDS:2 [Entrophospora sp. SA101]|nr:17744_t:CDS:2 [Entrophospora sp. SA101]
MYSRRDLKEFENQSISANRDRSPVSDNRYTATNTTNYTTTATTAAAPVNYYIPAPAPAPTLNYYSVPNAIYSTSSKINNNNKKYAMETGELVKRLSLLEDQKNLILSLSEEYGHNLEEDKEETDINDDGIDFEEEEKKIKLNPVDIFNAEDMLVEKQSFTIEEIKKEFNTIIRERDGADSLKSFLEISLAMERVILTPEAKAEIIVSSAEELEQVADNLKQIDELQSVIDAPEFKGLDRYLPEITPIEGKHIDQAARTNQVSARMTQLLDRYNGIVNTLSEIFISWDSILSTIDTNITEIERINEK